MTIRAAVAAVFSAAVIAGCASTGTPAPPAGAGAGTGLHRVSDPGQVTGSLAGPCTYRDNGQLPDPHCTPGAYDPKVTAARLCAPGYSTRSYRPPEARTQQFKYGEAYPAYGLPRTTRTELDHLVSLELGGANDAANLWPESPPTPNPKDRIEGTLHAWVCAVTGTAAQARLGKAQRAIARDWTTAEKVLGIPAGQGTPSPSQPQPVTSSPSAITSTPARARISSSPVTVPSSSPPPAPVACHPLTASGHCYEPGEFCRAADHGTSGIAGDGKRITCADNDGWCWEAA
jgi:hypothetical protein